MVYGNKIPTKLAFIDFLNDCIVAVVAGKAVLSCYADLSKADCLL